MNTADRKEDHEALGAGLHKAASEGDLTTAKPLLDNGADPNHQDEKGISPLHLAAKKGHWNVARLLLGRNASPSILDGDSIPPIIDAAKNGHLEIVRLLVECDPKTKYNSNQFWETPLLIAADRGDINMVRFLLDIKSLTTSSNRLRQTALHLAVKKGYIEICELLLEYDKRNGPNVYWRMWGIKPQAQVKARGEGMRGTPLAIAVHDGLVNMVELLLRSKSFSPDALNADKRLLFHDAVEASNREIVEIFLRFGVPVDMKGLNKRRALHIAARKGDVKMVKLLLEHGASVKTKDHVGATPENDSTSSEVTMILRNHGMDKAKGQGKQVETSHVLPPPPEYSQK
ncbi:hypothetical protein N7488_003393 [Penicillium malachiteum]|nr:hypothetical protein N7488_003393 [Penicillium malachiteum]